jgi:uncharacterized protein (DUF1684 family)
MPRTSRDLQVSAGPAGFVTTASTWEHKRFLRVHLQGKQGAKLGSQLGFNRAQPNCCSRERRSQTGQPEHK